MRSDRRKKGLFLLALIALFSLEKGAALPNENPAFFAVPAEGPLLTKEAWLGIKMGYQGDKLFERRMEGKGDHNYYSSLSNAGLFAFLFHESAEVRVILGAMSSEWKHDQSAGGRFVFQTHTDPVGSIGVKFPLFRKGKWGLMGDLTTLYNRGHILSISQNGANVSAAGSKLTLWETQAAPSLFYQANDWFPYLGVKFSEARAHLYDLKSLKSYFSQEGFRLRNQHKVGFFLGIGFAAETIFGLNIEMRMIDETAATLTGVLRF